MIGNPAYPTYQVFIAIAVAALVTGLAMPPFIRLLKKDGIGQQIRADGPQSHLVKQGTPTMGGVIILAGVVLTVALLAKWTPDLILAVIATLATGSLGLLDDIESVAHKRSLGLTPSQKMAGLITISVVFCLAAVNWVGIDAVIRFPGGAAIDLGVLTTTLPIAGGIQIPWLYLAFVFLLMAGLSNSVNLTDGLDGLAGGCTMVVMLMMAMVAFRYDEINLAIFAASIAGACVGFLWHNCNPASIFMGDTGSLALGAALAALAVLTKTEVTSLIMGGLFVCETLSVILQVTYFKLTHGKRIFKMTPIHHHFELCGWKEEKIVFVFTAITLVMCVLAYLGVMNRY